MIRTYCDRCDKKIEPYSGMKIKWEMGTSQLAVRPLFADDEGEYDLCDECSLEFKRWIDAKRMDKCEAARVE